MIEDTNASLDEELLARFDEKFNEGVPSDCWLWNAARSKAGYGQIRATRQRKTLYAHIVAFRRWNGDVPKGMEVCHRCNTPACVNPGHLFLGTRGDNAGDMVAKDRHPRGERSAQAKLTDATVSEIREAVAAGAKGIRQIGRELGISHQTVSKAARGETWKHSLTVT